jgi:rod shape-determining protein MreC
LRILVLGVAALLLIAGHFRWEGLERVESAFSVVATPFYWLADVPSRISQWSHHNLRDWRSLAAENERLRKDNLILQAKVTKMASLAAENARLRQLLNSATHLDDSVLIAELIGVSPDPLRHVVVINKGSEDGVYDSQPVIDAHGLVGQVVEVSTYFSRVLVITDSAHAVPVQVNRNGVRAIAEGGGRLDQLTLSHVAATTDIVAGDLLTTSGLGGVFPPGYPVAVVTEVTEDPGDQFLQVTARPLAHLDRSRHLLLVFSENGVPGPEAAAAEEGPAE